MARDLPFVWGVHDCALFAADVVMAITGVDYACEWRGRYHTALHAQKFLRSHGGLANLATKVLGDPMRASDAQRGDVVLRSGELGHSLGICIGATYAFTGLEGLVFLPLKECDQAWRV